MLCRLRDGVGKLALAVSSRWASLGGQVCGQVFVPTLAHSCPTDWRRYAACHLTSTALPKLVMKGAPVRVRASALADLQGKSAIAEIPLDRRLSARAEGLICRRE